MYFLSCITLFIFLFPFNPAMGYSRKNPNKEERGGGRGGIYRAIFVEVESGSEQLFREKSQHNIIYGILHFDITLSSS